MTTLFYILIISQWIILYLILFNDFVTRKLHLKHKNICMSFAAHTSVFIPLVSKELYLTKHFLLWLKKRSRLQKVN